MGGTLGLCDRSNHIIYIEDSQSEREKIQTLMHEVIHAISFRVGLSQAISSELEEIVCES